MAITFPTTSTTFSKGHTPWNKGKKYSKEILSFLRRGMVDNVCEICGDKYKITKHHAKFRRTCSRKCGAKLKSMEKSGKNHPMYGKVNHSTVGEKNYNWNGGITPINKKIRNSSEFIRWRNEVYKRDGWMCQNCNEIGGKLNAHHIKSFANYPEERFNIDNGVTLCISCHKLTDSYGNNKIKQTNI